MCSLSWRRFNDGLSLAFTRDESVLRPAAELPRVFIDEGIKYIMPRDPAGNGSWIAVNDTGLVIALLNDYQGVLKPPGVHLNSRGLLVRQLATCRTLEDVNNVIADWSLPFSQPFQLAVFFKDEELLWHYDGKANSISARPLSFHLFSSGHPDASAIIAARQAWVQRLNLDTESKLLALHRAHQPQRPLTGNTSKEDRAYSFCMHREEARSQSLTLIRVTEGKVMMRYWNGQPCETDHFEEVELQVAATL